MSERSENGVSGTVYGFLHASRGRGKELSLFLFNVTILFVEDSHGVVLKSKMISFQFFQVSSQVQHAKERIQVERV